MSMINYNNRLNKEPRDRDFSVFDSYDLTPSQVVGTDINIAFLSFNYHPTLSTNTLNAIVELESGQYIESSLDELLEFKDSNDI